MIAKLCGTEGVAQAGCGSLVKRIEKDAGKADGYGKLPASRSVQKR